MVALREAFGYAGGDDLQLWVSGACGVRSGILNSKCGLLCMYASWDSPAKGEYNCNLEIGAQLSSRRSGPADSQILACKIAHYCIILCMIGPFQKKQTILSRQWCAASAAACPLIRKSADNRIPCSLKLPNSVMR